MSCSCQDLKSEIQGDDAKNLVSKLREVKTTKYLTVMYQCESCRTYWEKTTLTAEHIGGGYFILKKRSTDHANRRLSSEKVFNISKELRSQFYEHKSEVLKRLKPHMGVFIYQDADKGEGFCMDSDDRLSFKFYPMSGADGGSCDIENVVEAFQTFKADLSDIECVMLAIDKFKQLIRENYFPDFK